MSAERPLAVLIGAMGGQGGGVLADWVVESARLAGYPAQTTSIPGVAQRTGATTYYVEIFPEANPSQDPIFCLFPSAGAVDLVVTMEPSEAVRAMENGHVTANTTVITAAKRIYSTAEKSVAGDGTVPASEMIAALRDAAKDLRVIDREGTALNATVFGAVIASGILPMKPEQARQAIAHKGVAVEANTATFEEGLGLSIVQEVAPPQGPSYDPAPDALQADLQGWPEPLRKLVGHSLARLTDYQGTAYAKRYLERLARVRDLDATNPESGWRLTREVAKRLAAWMSVEDVIRVAQLKTRAGRLARIRGEVGARDGIPVRVQEYLKPGRAELLGLLPTGLVNLLPGGLEGAHPDRGIAVKVNTTSAAGYGLMKLLAALRPLRPLSAGMKHENTLIESWLEAVVAAAPVDYDLALQLAELSVWSRGYGAVRRRGQQALRQLLENWATRLQSDRENLKKEVSSALHEVRHNPDCRA